MTDMPNWEKRYRAPNVTFPQWAPDVPNRMTVNSNESGVWQVHAWDLREGTRRQVTDHPVGVVEGAPTYDGGGVVYWQDETGDESGRWYLQPFEGGPANPFLDGVPVGWNEGIAMGRSATVAAVSDRDGFAVYAGTNGGEMRRIHRHIESVRMGCEGSPYGALSADESLVVVEHAEHGDIIHQALRVIDARTGEAVGDIRDEGMNLRATCWSTVPGDARLAFVHERDGEEQPGIWDLRSGARTDLKLGLPGISEALDWWPDGRALLIGNMFEGRGTLHRYEIASGTLEIIPTPPGTISGGGVRPDGVVWFRHNDSAHPTRILNDRHEEVVRPPGPRAPEGRGFVSWHFQNEHGQTVHGFHVAPPGDGPFPMVMLVHGGPTWLDEDRWYPEAQAYVDAGMAVGLVNYRGSVGYGREWRDTLIGNIGGPELEDVNAGLADLVARGIADPSRAVIAGWSWGGYTTLMELGTHPELWLCGVAGVPVGDYELSYEDMSPVLQAYDRALLGGAPKDVPALMRERNPIYFADHVRAPVMFVIGENDSRCPYRQAMAYVEKLAARDHPHEVYVFGTGHSSFDIGEEVRQQRAILEFLAKHVPGVTVPG